MTSDLSSRAVLELALVRGCVTVPDVVRELALPSTTALGVVQRLSSQGLIARGADLPTRRGRPIASYRPVMPESAIACLIDGTEVLAASVSKRLEVGTIFRSSTVEAQQPDQLIERIRSVIEPAAETIDAGAGVVLAVNAVELAGRMLSSSVIPGINEVIRRLMNQELSGTSVELSTPPMILAEYRHLVASAIPCEPMLVLRVGDGVSSHAIINRDVYHGASRLAGEMGHVTVDPQGPLCGCGRRGCLETLCNGPAIRRKLLDGLREGVVSSLTAQFVESSSPRAVIERAWQAWRDGDSFVRAVMEGMFDQIAWAAGLAVNLYDPRIVVVGGYVLKGRDAWINEIHRRAQRWILHAARRESSSFVSGAATDEEYCQLIALQNVHRDVLDSAPAELSYFDADPKSQLAQLLLV